MTGQPSGYNGNFGEYAMANGAAGEAARKNALGKRPDGTDYVWPKYVVPSRIYIGKKGVNAQGQAALMGALARLYFEPRVRAHELSPSPRPPTLRPTCA